MSEVGEIEREEREETRKISVRGGVLQRDKFCSKRGSELSDLVDGFIVVLRM